MFQLDLETWGGAVMEVYIAGAFCQNENLSFIQGLSLRAYPEVILR